MFDKKDVCISDNKYFAILPEQRFGNNVRPLQELYVPHHQRCSLHCLENIQCNSAVYQKASNNCQLFTETPTPTNTQSAVGFTIYN